jgi:hypothetical protein
VADLDIAAFGPARVAWATFREIDGAIKRASVVSENGDVWVCDGHEVEPFSVQVVFDPAQELADVAAKRMILDAHESLWTTGPLPLRSAPACKTCSSEVEGWPCTTLRLLAQPYAEHPDYDESWKP